MEQDTPQQEEMIPKRIIFRAPGINNSKNYYIPQQMYLDPCTDVSELKNTRERIPGYKKIKKYPFTDEKIPLCFCGCTFRDDESFVAPNPPDEGLMQCPWYYLGSDQERTWDRWHTVSITFENEYEGKTFTFCKEDITIDATYKK